MQLLLTLLEPGRSDPIHDQVRCLSTVSVIAQQYEWDHVVRRIMLLKLGRERWQNCFVSAGSDAKCIHKYPSSLRFFEWPLLKTSVVFLSSFSERG